MRFKGIGRFFILFVALFIVLIGTKKILQKYSISLPEIASRFLRTEKKNSTRIKTSNNLESNILAKLSDLEVREDEITTHFLLEHKRKEIKAAVPKGRPFEWIIWQFHQCAKGTPYTVTDCVFKKKKKTYTVTYTSSNPKKEKIVLIISKANRFQSNSAKIAILIEDFNFEANQTTIDFLSFPEPLTISLVPSYKKSSWTAQAADEYNKEIVIHLPFEPQGKGSSIPASSIIMIHYPEEKIRGIITTSIKTIPNFSGFANLRGSIALEDSRIMNIVLTDIKKHHGYFIDTYTGKNSVVSAIAQKKHIPFEEVTTVIKEKSDVSAIEDQLKHLAVVAQKKSKILISAKACQPFIQALTNVLPVFKQNGIRLVYVSEIVNHPKEK